MKKLLPLALLALAACQADPPTVPVIVRVYEAQARRDSARGAQLDSTAHTLYQQAQAAADSATFYHLQSTHAQTTSPGDTAALRRFFANYPAAGPVR